MVSSCRIVWDLTDPTKNKKFWFFFLWNKFFLFCYGMIFFCLDEALRVFIFSCCDVMTFYFLFYKIMLT